MNPLDTPGDPHRNPPAADGAWPDGMRWRLRELRREQAPARDLWPDIAVRLATPEAGAHAPLYRAPQPHAARRWQLPVALAATLALALGFIAWQQDRISDQRATPSPLAAALPDASPSLVQREAAGMTRQYQAALVEIGGVPSDATPGLQPAFDELDRSARLILDALEHDPDSRLLLQQLRRTYSHHLALAQRVAIS